MARKMFGTSMVTASLLATVSVLIGTRGVLANGACKYECKLGYQFCEPTRGSCRNCEDFKDDCFKDFLHISNCSSYCLDHLQLLKSEQGNSVGHENDKENAVYITLGLVCFALAVGLICAVSYIIYEKCGKKGAPASADSSLLSSKNTFTTGTTDETEPLKSPDPDLEVIVEPLNIQLEVRDNRLEQIPTENDTKSAMYVTGKKYDKTLSGQADD